MNTPKLKRTACILLTACSINACATAPNFGSASSTAPKQESSTNKAGVAAGIALAGLIAWLIYRHQKQPPPKDDSVSPRE